MSRTVAEWIGKTDDTRPSTACQRRILARQGHCCAITGRPFNAKEKPEFDHIVPLWLGGANRESNLHAIIGSAHKAKSATEAGVRAKIDAQTNAQFGLSSAKKHKIKSAPFPTTRKPARIQKQQLAPRNLYAPIQDARHG